jgi:glycosyltransferase involved in cell wall biosynthesis
MAGGLPVVATDIPAVRELVGPENERFLGAPGEPRALADAVTRVLALDCEARADLGRRNAVRVAVRHGVAGALEPLAALIAERLRRERRPRVARDAGPSGRPTFGARR